MKCLKGMKMENKWVILLAAAIFLAVGGFTQSSRLAAAETEDDGTLVTMDYLDPFDLTVQSYFAPANSPDRVVTTSETTFVSASSSAAYTQPLKIWIPYRPRFRSPCQPSW